jgi:modulator of FtsH protease
MQYREQNTVAATATYPQESALAANKLIRNTYTLLAMTLLFSAITAGVSMVFNIPMMHPLIFLVGYFALIFMTMKLRNSVWGLAAIFALTGFMGLTLGSIIEMYLSFFSNGSELVMLAFGGTAAIFLGLSGYALSSRKDFSFMGGFLFAGILVAFLAGLGALFFSISALSLAVSALFVLLMAGLILYQTSQMVHGHEDNYIMATVTLYVSIFNLFTSLLQLLGFSMGED